MLETPEKLLCLSTPGSMWEYFHRCDNMSFSEEDVKQHLTVSHMAAEAKREKTVCLFPNKLGCQKRPKTSISEDIADLWIVSCRSYSSLTHLITLISFFLIHILRRICSVGPGSIPWVPRQFSVWFEVHFSRISGRIWSNVQKDSRSRAAALITEWRPLPLFPSYRRNLHAGTWPRCRPS